MSFSSEYKALIKNLYQFKAWRILTEFSKINYKREKLDTLLKKIQETGSNDHRHESGRLKHVHTEENMTTVDELVGLLSHYGLTQTHLSTRQIFKETGLHSVQIIHRGLGL